MLQTFKVLSKSRLELCTNYVEFCGFKKKGEAFTSRVTHLYLSYS